VNKQMVKKPTNFDNYESRFLYLIETVGGWDKSAQISSRSVPQLRRYAKGDDAPFSVLLKLSATVGVSLQWLATGEGEPNATVPTASNDSYVAIPVMKAKASAGGGAVAIDEGQNGWLKFDRTWLHNTWHLNPADLFTIPSVGESMEPTIKAGEYLLASRSEQHLKLADGIYIIRLEGNILVKRIQVLPGRKIIISSDNPAYKPYEIKLDDGVDFDILGKVVLVHGVRKV
jgi:phage repressor protein C with HTH and peptisase S24 domain